MAVRNPINESEPQNKLRMKSQFRLLLLLGLLTVSTAVRADALENNQIPADAKWLLHLDLENLRKTQLGKFAMAHLDKALEEAKAAIKMDLRPVLQKVSYLTAYGDDYAKGPQASGVLLVKMDAETQKILEGLIASQMLAAKDDSIKKVQQDASVLYSLKDELHLAIEPNHVVVVSKSQNQIEKARQVLAGKSPNQGKARAFSGFPATPNTFFMLAVAEAFNENSDLPPQAKILQMTDAGRIVLGEKTDKVFLELILRAKTKELVQQIQQVVQGMVALVSLSQVENPELIELANAINVTPQEKMVVINVEYSLAKIMNKLSEEMEKHHKPQGRKPKANLEKDSEDKPASDAPKKP